MIIKASSLTPPITHPEAPPGPLNCHNSFPPSFHAKRKGREGKRGGEERLPSLSQLPRVEWGLPQSGEDEVKEWEKVRVELKWANDTSWSEAENGPITWAIKH